MEIKDVLRKNLEKLRELEYFTSNLSLSQMANVSSATINTFTLLNHSTHPKINKLDQVATALKVPAWALLIEDFPFERYAKDRIKGFSAEGIELLQILDKLNDKDTEALMDYARYIAKK